MLFDVNLALEVDAVAHLHEFVRVAGVAIFAGKLAAAIRIDGPLKRHAAPADAAVQKRLGFNREVLDVMPFAQRFAF
jgi:hypothetical protein